MTRYPLSTPLRVLRGGSDQEITATSDVMEMARTFSGGWLGTEGVDRSMISRMEVTRAGQVPGRRERPRGHTALPSKGKAGELAGCEVMRSHCPIRGNANFYEHLNDNTSP